MNSGKKIGLLFAALPPSYKSLLHRSSSTRGINCSDLSSAAIITAYLMRSKQFSQEDALESLQQSGDFVCPSDGFLDQATTSKLLLELSNSSSSLLPCSLFRYITSYSSQKVLTAVQTERNSNPRQFTCVRPVLTLHNPRSVILLLKPV